MKIIVIRDTKHFLEFTKYVGRIGKQNHHEKYIATNDIVYVAQNMSKLKVLLLPKV